MVRAPSALELFRLSLDTVQIAVRLGITEAVASRLVFEQRCNERDLTMHYERHVRRLA